MQRLSGAIPFVLLLVIGLLIAVVISLSRPTLTDAKTEVDMDKWVNSLVIVRDTSNITQTKNTGVKFWGEEFAISKDCSTVYYEANHAPVFKEENGYRKETTQPVLGIYELNGRGTTLFPLTALNSDGGVYSPQLSFNEEMLGMGFNGGDKNPQQVIMMSTAALDEPKTIYTASNEELYVEFHWVDNDTIAVQETEVYGDNPKSFLVNLTNLGVTPLSNEDWDLIPGNRINLREWDKNIPGSYTYETPFGHQIFVIWDQYVAQQVTAVCH